MKKLALIAIASLLGAMDMGDKMDMLFNLFNSSNTQKNSHDFNVPENANIDTSVLENAANNASSEAQNALKSANPENAYNNSKDKFSSVIDKSKENMSKNNH